MSGVHVYGVFNQLCVERWCGWGVVHGITGRVTTNRPEDRLSVRHVGDHDCSATYLAIYAFFECLPRADENLGLQVFRPGDDSET